MERVFHNLIRNATTEKGFIVTPSFFKGRQPSLQMMLKRAAPTNPFEGAAGVISRPLQIA
jgi:hypothetical protein